MRHSFLHAPYAATGAWCALFFAGCEEPQIRVYTIAKETPAPKPAAAAEPAAERPPRTRPKLQYALPAGWQESGGASMSLVNFVIKTGDGEATVNITPLAGMMGREAAIVNMWRAQVGMPALPDAEVAATFVPVEIAGGSGQLFEVAGTNDQKLLRIVTAFAHRGDDSWFYKLQGSEAVVAAQKPAFIEFLKTVRIEEDPAAAETAAAPALKWTVPEGWTTLPTGQMQRAKFAVPAQGEAKAEVSVSVFPNEAGGTLANVNRWRRQLGLGDVDDTGLKEVVAPLGDAPGAQLVDLVHENRRMLGAIVPRDGQWWFYKLMGDAPAVNAAREAFVAFAQSPP